MTDLEITRRCAGAMGIKKWKTREEAQLRSLFPNPDWDQNVYDPLHNDAQCLALVKKMGLHIVFQPMCPDTWRVDDTEKNAASPDLNRAICLTVAKMGEAK